MDDKENSGYNEIFGDGDKQDKDKPITNPVDEEKKQEDSNKSLIAKCQKCGKEGWIGSSEHPDGEYSKRLFLFLGNKILCERCI